jgi:hypothetical protein
VVRRKHLVNSSRRRITRRHLLRLWLPYNRGQITHYLARRTLQPDNCGCPVKRELNQNSWLSSPSSDQHPEESVSAMSSTFTSAYMQPTVLCIHLRAALQGTHLKANLTAPTGLSVLDQGIKQGSLGNVIGHMNNLGWCIGRAAIAADPIRGRCTPLVTLAAALRFPSRKMT